VGLSIFPCPMLNSNTAMCSGPRGIPMLHSRKHTGAMRQVAQRPIFPYTGARQCKDNRGQAARL
jgi:hypothetical protein